MALVLTAFSNGRRVEHRVRSQSILALALREDILQFSHLCFSWRWYKMTQYKCNRNTQMQLIHSPLCDNKVDACHLAPRCPEKAHFWFHFYIGQLTTELTSDLHVITVWCQKADMWRAQVPFGWDVLCIPCARGLILNGGIKRDKDFKKKDQFSQYSIYNSGTWEKKPENWVLHGQSHLCRKAQASRVTWNPIFNKKSDGVIRLLRASPLERISTEFMGPPQGFKTDPSLSSGSQPTLVIPSCGSYSGMLPVAKVWLSQGL